MESHSEYRMRATRMCVTFDMHKTDGITNTPEWLS